jgi:hypothetical protein
VGYQSCSSSRIKCPGPDSECPPNIARTFGYGVPVPRRSMSSDSNRPVMIHEGTIRPSRRNSKGKPDRRADFIELPMPHDELDHLAETPVTIAVALSYFIEPTDNLTSVMLTSRAGLKIHVFGYASDIEGADLNGAVGYQKCLNAWPAALSVVSLYG